MEKARKLRGALTHRPQRSTQASDGRSLGKTSKVEGPQDDPICTSINFTPGVSDYQRRIIVLVSAFWNQLGARFHTAHYLSLSLLS